MKLPVLILGILIVLIITFLLFSYSLPKTPRPQTPERSNGGQASAEINGHVFSLYLAQTSGEQSVGLAKYKKIDMNQGMLFLFPKPDYYSFWMKNMQFPIDIIFINGNKVVHVFQKVPVSLNGNLPVYTTKTKADKVLEINAGLASKYNIKVGDRVNMKL